MCRNRFLSTVFSPDQSQVPFPAVTSCWPPASLLQSVVLIYLGFILLQEVRNSTLAFSK